MPRAGNRSWAGRVAWPIARGNAEGVLRRRHFYRMEVGRATAYSQQYVSSARRQGAVRPLPLKPVGRPLARWQGVSVFWEWGYRDLPACGPGLAHLIKQAQSGVAPLKAWSARGQASRGGTTSRPAGWLIRTPPGRWIFLGETRPQVMRMTRKKDMRAADSRTE